MVLNIRFTRLVCLGLPKIVSSISPEHKEEFRVITGPALNFLLEWITKTVLGIREK